METKFGTIVIKEIRDNKNPQFKSLLLSQPITTIYEGSNSDYGMTILSSQGISFDSERTMLLTVSNDMVKMTKGKPDIAATTKLVDTMLFGKTGVHLDDETARIRRVRKNEPFYEGQTPVLIILKDGEEPKENTGFDYTETTVTRDGKKVTGYFLTKNGKDVYSQNFLDMEGNEDLDLLDEAPARKTFAGKVNAGAK